jgi:hypothetical protein
MGIWNKHLQLMEARESQIRANTRKHQMDGLVTPTVRAHHTRFRTQKFEMLGFDVQSVRNRKQPLR